MTKAIKKYKYYLLAFILPLAIFVAMLWVGGVFTSKSIIFSDLSAQYVPELEYLRDLLHGNASFPYTLEKGLGGTMYGAFFYALANPLNLLIYFFDDVELFIICLVTFKIALSGLTMYTFLNHKYQGNSLHSLIFSLAYALMSYNLVYFLNYMWLDSVVLAPLIFLGIENICAKKSDVLYIVTLFLGIVLNYYTGYILTIGSILYYIYQLYVSYPEEKWFKNNYKKILRFFFLTFLIGLMTMFILIPIAYESINYARIDTNKRLLFNYNFLSFFASNTIGFGNFTNPLNYYGFLIYAGTVMVPLVIYYFSSSSVSKREKRATAIMYLFFLLPTIITPLNALWHLFTYPQGFNYRYSFLTTLFSIMIAFKAFRLMDGSKKHLKIAYILLVIVFSSLIYLSYSTPEYYIYLSPLKIMVTLILLLISFLLVAYKRRQVILVLLCLELVLNVFWLSHDTNYYSKKELNSIQEKVAQLGDICPDDQRCESIYGNTLNASLLNNYNGLNVFLSSLNERPVDFLLQAEDFGTIANFFEYQNNDLALETILGVKYILYDKKVSGYNEIKSFKIKDKTAHLLENPYALPLMYSVNPQIKKFTSTKRGFKYLNEVLNAMNDDSVSYLYELPSKKIDGRHYELAGGDYPYVYIDTKEPPIGVEESSKSSNHYGIIYDVNHEVIELEFAKDVDNLKAYTLDLDKLKEFVDKRKSVIIDQNEGNYLKGHMDLASSTTIFTSIPYEKGWNVYVDGNKVKTYEVLDAFIAFDLNSGNHVIEFKYTTPGLKLGIGISLLSMLVLFIYELKKKKVID